MAPLGRPNLVVSIPLSANAVISTISGEINKAQTLLAFHKYSTCFLLKHVSLECTMKNVHDMNSLEEMTDEGFKRLPLTQHD